MIRTWLADVSVLKSEVKYQECYQKLPPERKEKADKLAREQGRWQSVGAGTLLERMRSRYDPTGKALYNLSHAGMYAICSMEDDERRSTKLGCDIEVIKEYRRKVAAHFYTETEFHMIENCAGEEEKKELFYRFWVLKESFMKATRLGTALSPRAFEIGFEETGARLLSRPEEFSEPFFYREYETEGVGAKIAVCADEDDFAPELHIEIL